ncbi:MAG: 2-C-methyl-D-erythritol 2,4-cyclodiphosphate synthase [Planctomyces sp.]|nr:2-C-methyl-D-erythritol 2,4-cyclodiphosphate synthase [Planctomyces sp.]
MPSHDFRVGEGHDTHRTIPGRPLMLGGVLIEPSPFGLDGHSDADVLLHAITDALLGAAALGDIGDWFPNTDDRWKGANSAELLQTVLRDVKDRGWDIINLDCTVHAERPKLMSWKPGIRNRLAELLEIEPERVNVKAKSGERVGPVGREEAITADAVVLICHR